MSLVHQALNHLPELRRFIRCFKKESSSSGRSRLGLLGRLIYGEAGSSTRENIVGTKRHDMIKIAAQRKVAEFQ